MLGGGHRPGEVYTIQGPIGVTQHLLAAMISVEQIRTSAKERSVPKVSAYFSWETGRSYLDSVLVSCASELPAKVLETRLTDTKMAMKREAALTTLADNAHVFDFTTQSGKWAPWYDAVVASLQKLVDQGRDIGVVILDHAKAAVMAGAYEKLNRDGARKSMQHFVLDAAHKVAARFHCPVYVLHELRHVGIDSTDGDLFAECATFDLRIKRLDCPPTELAGGKVMLHAAKARRRAQDAGCLLQIEEHASLTRVLSLSNMVPLTGEAAPPGVADARSLQELRDDMMKHSKMSLYVGDKSTPQKAPVQAADMISYVTKPADRVAYGASNAAELAANGAYELETTEFEEAGVLDLNVAAAPAQWIEAPPGEPQPNRNGDVFPFPVHKSDDIRNWVAKAAAVPPAIYYGTPSAAPNALSQFFDSALGEPHDPTPKQEPQPEPKQETWRDRPSLL
jgi:hypothetical protein